MKITCIDNYYHYHTLPYIEEILSKIINDPLIDHKTKIYISMASAAMKNNGYYKNSDIRFYEDKLETWLSKAETNFIYFDDPPGRPLHDFFISLDKEFVYFYLKKIAINYVIDGKVCVNNDYFLNSLVDFCGSNIYWRTVYDENKAIGTVVSNRVMSLNHDCFNDCVIPPDCSETGFWLSDLSKHHVVDENLCNNIINLIKEMGLLTVYDIGCGNGFYTSKINSNNLQCIGIDGNPNTESIPLCIRLDLSSPLNLPPQDAVFSLEVGEHIPKSFEGIFLDNICKLCKKLLIISWAIPGQGGLGHANCQANQYIINQVESRGFKFNMDVTNRLKNNLIHGYFNNTIMCFFRA